MAELYAAVEAKFWLVEDEEYDWPEGTKQYAWATEHTDRWHRILKMLENRIFAVLQSEGVVIPDTKRIEVLIPFMERNGYRQSSGWWLKIDRSE